VDSAPCPFRSPTEDRLLRKRKLALALTDGFPVSEGHALVVPRRHVASLCDLEAEEQAAIWAMVAEVRADITERLRPDGFNIGLNDGRAAGQTVMHAHVHVIPRFDGDVPDPRGGIRWVVPAKAAYWREGDA
jgi:diadenosine tetraphosphate (Ap4A) HIT family hydrolase